MSYHIDAHLNGRHPRLEVQDADTGCVRMIWEYRRRETDSARSQLEAEAAIDELFRRLFLLTTADRLKRN